MTPINRMHQLYGRNDNFSCSTCCNMITVIRKKKQALGCVAYGLGISESWRARSAACGLHNKPFKQTGLRTIARPRPPSRQHMSVFFGQESLDV